MVLHEGENRSTLLAKLRLVSRRHARRASGWRNDLLAQVREYNVEEMTYALKTADAKFIMTHRTSMDVATAAAKNAGIPKERLFLLEGELEGYTTVKQLIEMGKKESQQVPYFRIPPGKTNFRYLRVLVIQLWHDWSS